MQVELLEQLLLDAGADAVAEQRAVGHDHAAAPARLAGGAAQLAHDELQEQQRRLGGLLVLGEVALDAALLLAAEGRVGQDHVHPVLVADLGEREAQAVAGVDLRGLQAVQQQVHLAEQVGQRLGLAAEDALAPAASCGPRPSCTASPGGCRPRPGSRRCRRPGRGRSRRGAGR